MINNLTEIQNILCNLCGNVLFGKNNRILENFDSGELFTEAKHQTVFPASFARSPNPKPFFLPITACSE